MTQPVEQTRLGTQLAQKEKELFSIQKIGRALSNTLQLDNLLDLIMKEITQMMDADRSTLYLIDRQKGEIWSKIALKAEVREIRQKIGKGISGYVAETGETVNIPDAYRDSRFDPSTDKRTGYRTRSILCLPVWQPAVREEEREIMGVIQVLNKKEGHFTAADEGILAAIASQVAIAISNARLYQQLEKKYREIDLLHEFEQMLSAEFQLDQIFRRMLGSSLQHLGGESAALIFPERGSFRVLQLDRKGAVQERSLAHLKEAVKTAVAGSADELTLRSENVRELLRELMLSGEPYTKIIRLEDDDNPDRLAVLFFSRDAAAGNGSGLADLQLLDIVEQKILRALDLQNLRETLLSQERLSAVGKMMSTIVHDLRTPVSAIHGFTELLTDEEITPGEKKEYADIIRMEIQSITNMTTEILDFAKGKTSILPRKSSVSNIVKRFRPTAEQLFRNSGIEFRLENSSRKLIYVDEEKFTRVLYNITKNAKEALANRGTFLFKSYDLEDKVVFELRDNGPGIPEEIRNRLFESFVTSGKEHGTGLGLAIVKKIVDEHHGQIDIQSQTGKGTLFLIELPEYKKE